MVPERPNAEDVIINRLVGKRLSREEEFVFEYDTQERTREVKRRLLEKHMPQGDLSFNLILDFKGQQKNTEVQDPENIEDQVVDQIPIDV
jgi:hypothetical protein